MKKLFTLIVLSLAFVVGVYAQNEVHIVQRTGTTVVNLDDVSSIQLTDEPWSEWEWVNTATYNYTGSYWSSAYEGVTVRYRESLINDVEGQFGVTYIEDGVEYGMAGGFEFLIDYNRKTGECQVPVQQVAVNSNYGPVFVCDPPHYPLQAGLTYEQFPCTYDAEKGLFTLNLIYFVSADLGSAASGYFGKGVKTETIQLDGFYIPDYSFNMQYVGSYVDDNGNNYAVIQAVKGVDISKYQIKVVPADSDLDSIAQEMIDGAECYTFTENAEIKYQLYTSDKYVVVAVTYDENELPENIYASSFFEFWMDGSNPWQSLGYAMYTEDCLTTFFNVPNETYPVEVREHKEQPGLFRIIHPYAAYGADTEEEYYIEIDATDPEGVIIPGLYGTGLDVGYGEVSISSMAYYYMATEGYTKEDVKDGGLCGVYADNVITFPAEGLLISMANYKNGSFYISNYNGAFKLDMTNMTAENPAEAAARAPKARLGRIKANEAFEISGKAINAVGNVELHKEFEMPAKKISVERVDIKQNCEMPGEKATSKPVAPVKFKKADASQNALIEI